MNIKVIITCLGLLLLTMTLPAMADQAVLPLTQGWDQPPAPYQQPTLTSGTVTRDFNPITGEFSVDFNLVGSSLVNSSNYVGFDIFDTSPGIGWFGVIRYASGTFTREGNMAYVDIFFPGWNGIGAAQPLLSLDPSGNGDVIFHLNLYQSPDVPAGTYHLQYAVSHAYYNVPHVVYRTGTQYDVGFDEIVVPEHATVPEPATMLLLGSGLIGLAGYGRKKFFKK